jgi:hypothetical protein
VTVTVRPQRAAAAVPAERHAVRSQVRLGGSSQPRRCPERPPQPRVASVPHRAAPASPGLAPIGLQHDTGDPRGCCVRLLAPGTLRSSSLPPKEKSTFDERFLSNPAIVQVFSCLNCSRSPIPFRADASLSSSGLPGCRV